MARTPAADRKIMDRFDRYRSMFPDEHDDRCWAATAESFGIEGDGPNTITCYRKAIAKNPEWGRWHLEIAKAYLRARKYAEAISHLDRCAELDSSGCRNEHFAENVLYYLGYALFGSRRWKEAAESWRGAAGSITMWRQPEPLKEFHMHRGWAHQLENNLLDAIEAYRRGLVAPGPGDCSEDDDMDPDQVEAAQGMNAVIEGYYNLAKAGVIPDAETLVATPYTHG